MKSIAVIIPAYNAERFIQDAVKSVKEQSLPPAQIIVVNDGSTDKTGEIVHAMDHVLVIDKQNTGIGGTLNAGLERANTDLISFLDADDLWVKDKLAIQMKEFKKMKYSGMVFGQMEQFFQQDMGENLKARLENPKQFLPGVHRSTMLIDKDSMHKVGLFATNYISEEFLDWYLRAKEMEIDVKIIDDLVAKRRIHGDNITLGMERKMANKFPSILKQALDRRRAKE